MKKILMMILLVLISILLLSTCDLVDSSAIDAIIATSLRDNPLDSNFWDRRADCPITRVGHPVTFSIGDKGYIGLGVDWGGGSSDMEMLKDLWEYDVLEDNWSRKADFPGTGKEWASAFVIDGVAYIVGGKIFSKQENDHYDSLDCWKYEPGLDQWTEITGFTAPADGTGLFGNKLSVTVSDGKGWVHAPTGDKEFFYDSGTDTWTDIENISGERSTFIPQENASGIAYILAPEEDEILSYNPSTRFVDSVVSFSSELINMNGHFMTFVIANRVYLYTGKYAPGEDSLISYPINAAGGTDEGLLHGNPAASDSSPWSQVDDGDFYPLIFSDRVYMMIEGGEFYLFKP